MMHYVRYPGDDASDDEKSAWAERECQVVLVILESIAMGLMVRHGGLIWRVPLCHDGFDY